MFFLRNKTIVLQLRMKQIWVVYALQKSNCEIIKNQNHHCYNYMYAVHETLECLRDPENHLSEHVVSVRLKKNNQKDKSCWTHSWCFS